MITSSACRPAALACQGALVVAVQHLQLDVVACFQAAQGAEPIQRAVDLLPIYGQQNVAALDAGLCCGSVCIDPHDNQPRLAGGLGLGRGQRRAKRHCQQGNHQHAEQHSSLHLTQSS
jgi:hypothetical protein